MYLCISTYNLTLNIKQAYFVVNCFKMCIFALARTTLRTSFLFNSGCELLQNVYLCISTYNMVEAINKRCYVVNCFKMCIFALARTTTVEKAEKLMCCELLQNVYLCISTYNINDFMMTTIIVVNCFKMCIFALARTTTISTNFLFN